MNTPEQNVKNGKLVGVQHGEVWLQPVSAMPDGVSVNKTNKHIVGHSETGHHHVLTSKAKFEVMDASEKNDLYVRLFEPAELVHQKSYDIHETKTIMPGVYAVYQKTEYDPFAEVRRAVYD